MSPGQSNVRRIPVLLLSTLMLPIVWSQQVYSIVENRPINYVIANLSLEVEKAYPVILTQKITEEDNFNFIITNSREKGPDCFTIDRGNLLKIQKNIDRDEICSKGNSFPSMDFSHSSLDQHMLHYSRTYQNDFTESNAQMKPCIVDLKIAFYLKTIGDGSDKKKELKTLEIRIQIEDENDNSPVFPVKQMNLEYNEFSFSENDLFRELPRAHDPDEGDNGRLTYWMDDYVETEDNVIRVENPFNLTGPPLQLVLTKALDWENAKKYKILLHVRDNGSPSKSSSVLLTVNVIDENDWEPKFSKKIYQSIIDESVKEFTTILKIDAQDNDGNENGKISFSLATPRNFIESQSTKYFNIRSTGLNSATIYLQKSIDLDEEKIQLEDTMKQTDIFNVPFKSKVFKFRIIARDNGSPKRLSSEADIQVIVLDVNDIQPLITVTFMNNIGDQNIGSLEENTDKSFIGFVSVEDSDSGSWGEVTCKTDHESFELIPNPPQETFQAFPSNQVNFLRKYDYKLFSTKSFDREETFEVSFKIICTDNPKKVGSAYVKDNSNLISFNTDNFVQLTGTTLVRVQIQDRNDNPPRFMQNSYEFTINESNDRLETPEERNLHIGTIKALDADQNTDFTYSLSSDPINSFQIDNKTGIIFLTKRIDRESLLISALNGYHTKLNSIQVSPDENVVLKLKGHVSDQKHEITCDITIIVKDVNDCQPVFEQNEYVIDISESHALVSLGQPGLIHATDCDSKLYSKIFYQIQYISDGSSYDSYQFKIDSITGQLYLIRPLDRETQSQYRFYVVANDVGGSSYYNKNSDLSHDVKALVTVNVLDENDNAPSFINPSRQSQFIVKQKTPGSEEIFKVFASDPDYQENGTVTYQLKQVGLNSKRTNLTRLNETDENNNFELFTIDEVTGRVYLTHEMPEIIRDYYLLITAHDSGHIVSRNSSQTVIVKVVEDFYVEKLLLNQEGYDTQGEGEIKDKGSYFLSDKTIVLLLASIFIILLLTTVALLLLIKKRRKLEMQRIVHPMSAYKINLNPSMNNQEQTYLTTRCPTTEVNNNQGDKTSNNAFYRISRLQPQHYTTPPTSNSTMNGSSTLNDVFQSTEANLYNQKSLTHSADNLFHAGNNRSFTLNSFDKRDSISPNRLTNYSVHAANGILNQDFPTYMTMYRGNAGVNSGNGYQVLQRDVFDLRNRIIDNKFLKSTERLDKIKLGSLQMSHDSPTTLLSNDKQINAINSSNISSSSNSNNIPNNNIDQSTTLGGSFV